MHVLFITRKFPPTRGGMEKAAYELYSHLKEMTPVELVKWGGSNKMLLFILPYFLVKAFWILLTKKVDIIYVQDGLLSPLGVILKVSRRPVIITIHGLDMTYRNRVYQRVVPMCVRKMDRIICVSEATKKECVKRGIKKEIDVIPWGISDDFYTKDTDEMKIDLEEKLRTHNKKIILSVGRLVERKGYHWFAEKVLPLIVKQEDAAYVIAGDGPFRERIASVKKMEKYVFLLGHVDRETLKSLYNCCDVVVIPNISVENDLEGFGIVALEAASCGVPVVASNLEGVADAVIDGENGFLVEPHNEQAFSKIVVELLKDERKRKEFGKKARELTLRYYDWRKISELYLNVFEGGKHECSFNK